MSFFIFLIKSSSSVSFDFGAKFFSFSSGSMYFSLIRTVSPSYFMAFKIFLTS